MRQRVKGEHAHNLRYSASLKGIKGGPAATQWTGTTFYLCRYEARRNAPRAGGNGLSRGFRPALDRARTRPSLDLD